MANQEEENSFMGCKAIVDGEYVEWKSLDEAIDYALAHPESRSSFMVWAKQNELSQVDYDNLEQYQKKLDKKVKEVKEKKKKK